MGRGQITVFIILGLIFLISIFFIYHVSRTMQDKAYSQKSIDNARVQARNYMESCLKLTTVQAIKQLGDTGLKNPAWSENIDGLDVAYGQKWNFNLIPDADIFLQEVSEMVESQIRECHMVVPGYRISSGEPKVWLVQGDKSIFVRLKYPHTLKKGSLMATVDEYTADVPIYVPKALFTARDLVSQMIAAEPVFDLTDLDYSCDHIRICYSEGIVRIFDYSEFGKEPFFMYQFATDDQVFDSCTQYGGACP